MSTLFAISVSGMKAARTALDASAHNIANFSTAGFRREQVSQSTAADGGVRASLSRATQEGNALETDVVAQLVAKNQFLANLAVFRTSDRLMGALLDAAG